MYSMTTSLVRSLSVTSVGHRVRRTREDPARSVTTGNRKNIDDNDTNDNGNNNPATQLQQTTVIVLNDLADESHFFSENPKRAIPIFDPSEMEIGPELGHGEFGIVYEVTNILLEEDILRADGDGGGESLNASHLVTTQKERHSMQNQLVHSSSQGGGGDQVLSPFAPPATVVIITQEKKCSIRFTTSSDEDDNDDGRTGGTGGAHRRHDDDGSPPLAETAITAIDIMEEDDDQHSLSDSTCECVKDDNDDDDDDDAFPIGLEISEAGEKKEETPKSIKNRKSHRRMDSTCTATALDLRIRTSKRSLRDGQPRYALKRLKDKLDSQIRVDAALDLACEARFLQCISHSNIIRLRATVGKPGTDSFGLLLDRLTITLDKRIVKWHKEFWNAHGGSVGLLNLVFRRKALKERDHILYVERLVVVLDIARALRHMHKNRILYRDLKPDNVGFNVRGDVQIFDFGLAKELKPRDLVKKPDGYEATGLTGSRRYMAPEVVRCLPYGFSADVYSFAILFWQIFALATPFHDLDANKHYEQVVEGGRRPRRLTALPLQLHHMMQAGWNDDPLKRPNFKDICTIIRSQYMQAYGGNTADKSVMDRSVFLSERSLVSFYADADDKDNYSGRKD